MNGTINDEKAFLISKYNYFYALTKNSMHKGNYHIASEEHITCFIIQYKWKKREKEKKEEKYTVEYTTIEILFIWKC